MLSCRRSGSGLHVPLVPEPGEITAYSGCQSPSRSKHPLCGDDNEHFHLVLSSRISPCPTAVIRDQDKGKAKEDLREELWVLPLLLYISVSLADDAGQCGFFFMK